MKLTQRDEMRLVFPEWLVTLLGPYPDEVGAAPFAAKWICVLWLAINLVGLLVPRALDREFSRGVVVFGLAMIAAGHFGFGSK